MPVLIDVAERVGPWLYDQLATDPGDLVGGRIYLEEAPQGTAYPYIIYFLQTAEDKNNLNGRHLLDVQAWVVKIVAIGMDRTLMSQIIDRVLARLHGQGNVSVDGVRIGKVTRVRVLPQGPDRLGNDRVNYSNQVFSIQAYPR